MFEGSSAQKAGLKIGDKILSVDGNQTKGLSSEEARRLLQGADGTSFNVEIQRPGEKKSTSFTVERNQLNITNVPYNGFVADGIGYVILTTFTQNASQNIAKAIKELRKEEPNLKGLVFDLRNNGGGLLMEAINVSNLFIPKGEEVVTTRGKIKERTRTYKTLGDPAEQEIPLAILTNKSSASASEIVAGVIQDYDRGIIIGQRSYGKGLVQVTKDIGYNSKLKITTSKYYIPSGRCIQSVEYDDGEPKDVADSLRSTFKTRNGRPVLDGGGITPDLKMEDPEKAGLIKQLKDQDVIFKFATNWVIENGPIQDIANFNYDNFEAVKQFVQATGFNFKSAERVKLEELMKELGEGDYDQTVIDNVSNALNSIVSKDKNALDSNKQSILDNIEEEIVKRFSVGKDKILFNLKNDQEVLKAVELLNNPTQYQALLN